ncbi:MAG: hypothetical protein ACKPKO_18895, partial [Candidatus Fonsibacter sp.]
MEGEASRAPNVYSNGSANPLGAAIDVFAGTGCWWPERTVQGEGRSQFEGEYSQSTQKQDGLAMSAPLAGCYQTPMRAELCGAILLLAAAKPVFAAVDNAVVMIRSQQ